MHLDPNPWALLNSPIATAIDDKIAPSSKEGNGMLLGGESNRNSIRRCLDVEMKKHTGDYTVVGVRAWVRIRTGLSISKFGNLSAF